MQASSQRMCIACAAISIAMARPAGACGDGSSPPGGIQFGEDEAMLVARNVAANGGAATYLYTSTLVLSLWGSEQGDQASHSMIFVTEAGYYIDVGLYTDIETPDVVFWWENKPTGFYTHFTDVTFAFNTWEPVEVAFSGTSCAWNVYFAGVKLGTSTANCGPGLHTLEAGLMTDDISATAHVGGNLSGWEIENNGVWTSGWPGSFLFADCPADIEYTSASHTETEEKLHGPF